MIGSEKMKKTLYILFLLFLVVACSHRKTQTLEQFMKDADIENVEKIILQDGSTGALKTMTDKEQIDEFLSLIKNVQYIPLENQEKQNGWRYGITMVDGEKQFQFTPNNINDIYYDTVPDLLSIVGDFYEKLIIPEQSP